MNQSLETYINTRMHMFGPTGLRGAMILTFGLFIADAACAWFKFGSDQPGKEGGPDQPAELSVSNAMLMAETAKAVIQFSEEQEKDFFLKLSVRQQAQDSARMLVALRRDKTAALDELNQKLLDEYGYVDRHGYRFDAMSLTLRRSPENSHDEQGQVYHFKDMDEVVAFRASIARRNLLVSHIEVLQALISEQNGEANAVNEYLRDNYGIDSAQTYIYRQDTKTLELQPPATSEES